MHISSVIVAVVAVGVSYTGSCVVLRNKTRRATEIYAQTDPCNTLTRSHTKKLKLIFNAAALLLLGKFGADIDV